MRRHAPEVPYEVRDKVVLYTCAEFCVGEVTSFGINYGKQRTVSINCNEKGKIIGWADLAHKLPDDYSGTLFIAFKESLGVQPISDDKTDGVVQEGI